MPRKVNDVVGPSTFEVFFGVLMFSHKELWKIFVFRLGI